LQALITAGLIGGLAALAVGQSAAHGDDLVQDYVSARAWLAGEYAYQDAAELRERFGFPPAGQHVGRNPHPPLSVVLGAPFAWLPFETALPIYQSFQVLLLALAWHLGCHIAGCAGWPAAAAGGLLGLWSPVWQGLDWGQPVGAIALFATLLWLLARRQPAWGLSGLVLGLACALRPFFAIVAAAGVVWPARRIVVEMVAAVLAAGCVFAVVGLSPLEWLRAAAAVGDTFTGQCGSVPGVLGIGGLLGMAFFGVAFIAVALARWRGADVDGTVALALSVGLLTYPLAWFQYDVALIPVALWVAVTAHRRNCSPALWGAMAYVALRAVPNMHGREHLQQWLQVMARAALVGAVLFVTYACRRGTAGETHSSR
jgi:hypothetical protein